ncbi:MAG: hypothetical protein QOD46_47, partial [Actinomycetota bacterium]|nr:hypothetical protein [Actinomycetota bacterium]
GGRSAYSRIDLAHDGALGEMDAEIGHDSQGHQAQQGKKAHQANDRRPAGPIRPLISH